MIATNYSNVRNNLKKYCVMENLYIMSNKKYYNELLKRKEEVFILF